MKKASPSIKKRKAEWWDYAYEDPLIVGTMFGWKKYGADIEVETLLKKVKLKPGARILDLACGSGRHSIEFAKRGYSVVGLDYSELLLLQAHEAARKLPKGMRPEFVQADMRKVG